MSRYIIKRLLWMIPVILGVLVIVFTISYFTPGDPAMSMLGTNYTEESYVALREKLGLDKPFLVQLWNYLWGLISRGDLGTSYIGSVPVATEVVHRFPITFKLGIMSVIVTTVIGVPLGILSATKQYSVADYTVTSFALIIAAIPNYVFALLGLLLFAVKLGWLPVSGVDSWKSWVMPVAANSFGFIAVIVRMTRTSMLEVIRSDYIRTARSKGLRERLVIWKHAFPNALIPIVTVIGTQLSFIMAGSIIVETIFSIPGMGTYIMTGINSRDYPIINGTVLLLSLCICGMNLIVDIAYAFIDPRIKAQYESGRKRVKKAKIPGKAVP
ncbi:MAG: ABC transporter permease [Oscillospiraceae bacterium]|nr:ABC transporter permease [Oscillospiraceae bacterium]